MHEKHINAHIKLNRKKNVWETEAYTADNIKTANKEIEYDGMDRVQ